MLTTNQESLISQKSQANDPEYQEYLTGNVWRCISSQAHYWIIIRKKGVCRVCGKKKQFDPLRISSHGELRLPAERI